MAGNTKTKTKAKAKTKAKTDTKRAAERAAKTKKALAEAKKKGKLTVIGWCGIGLGILFMVCAGSMFDKAKPGEGEQICYFFLVGLGFSVASYLWARR